jgi:predicted nucleic acid-binding protein
MVVIADTSPINYLVLIGEIRILPLLYRRVLIPAAVIIELRNPGAPKPVNEWAANPPEALKLSAG